MKTEMSLSILNPKAKNLYYKIEDNIEKLMQDSEWSFDGQTMISHAHTTSSCYFTFSYWNNNATLDFSVRISDHASVTGRIESDLHLNINNNYTKAYLKEQIEKFIIHD